jgi:HD superfamily phosphodiesterase
MNSKDKNPDYKKIYRFVTDKFTESLHFKHGPFDETFYTLRVYESAKKIANKLDKNVKLEPLLVSALLHDIGKTKLDISKLFDKTQILRDTFSLEWRKHAKLSTTIAKPYLEKLGHSEQFIDEVCYLIENHAKRGDKLNQRTLELEILQDADLLADIGLFGFIRPFLYSGKFSKQSIIDAINFIKKEDRTDNGKELNLDISKLLAKKKTEFQNFLINESLKEIDSELL